MQTSKEEQWIKAAGEHSISDALKKKIIRTGEFISGYYSGDKVCEALSGIDFNKDVSEVKLPLHFYIRWGGPGPWFTDIGWRALPEAIGLMPTSGKPKVYYPDGSGVSALACRAKSINVNWHVTPGQLDKSAEAKIRKRWAELRQWAGTLGKSLPEECPNNLQKYVGGEKVQGGGVQYFVQQPKRMLESPYLPF